VGVCGTDRELAGFQFGFPPPGDNYLVLGHEALAQVAATGPAVKNLRPGDWVVPMIWRACDRRAPPARARSPRPLCVARHAGARDLRVARLLGGAGNDEEEDLVPIPPSGSWPTGRS
jgi:threonine dehydrogenase-like Zn-dependent dehydrogenase